MIVARRLTRDLLLIAGGSTNKGPNTTRGRKGVEVKIEMVIVFNCTV